MQKMTFTKYAAFTLSLACLTTAYAAPNKKMDDKPNSVHIAYPAPAPLKGKDASLLGVNIQRTMTLLATSTSAHRNKVRILFYGQSITEQEWSKQVADAIRKRFPNADLEIENKAIGGFASQLLIRPAEHDLYPFYPDLLIFHVYGGNGEYEQIIKNTRSRTTAEVLMQKDHVTQWPPAVPDQTKDKGMWWDDMMNNHFLPEIAQKYGCGIADDRTPWLDYLKTNHYEPKQLLKDGVHLNDHGNFLMAALVERNLVYRPELSKENWKNLVRSYKIGKDVKPKDGKLTLEFEGNRVDLLPERSAKPGTTVQVLIDGKKPSAFPELYAITRPSPGPWSPLAVVRVNHDSPLITEDWTLKITSVNADSTKWTFDVAGSVTGADGSGSNDATFTSKSGRVKIDPEGFFSHGTIPVGYEAKWKVYPLHSNTFTVPEMPDASREYPITIALGLPNTKHKLEILPDAQGKIPVDSIRSYCPPVK